MTSGVLSAADLMAALHAKNPYDGFDGSLLQTDLQGWNSERPVFQELIERTKPRLIVEVGAWKGASAIFMGRTLQKKYSAAKILAVDTWLGSAEFWDRDGHPGLYKTLRHRHGLPSVYEQFLFNVLQAGLQDMIVPFPQTSLNAARWLARRGVQAELIYIDASHEAEDVALDLKNYFAIVAPGGMIFGDDYGCADSGVASAVRQFAEDHQVAVELKENSQFWTIQKGRHALL